MTRRLAVCQSMIMFQLSFTEIGTFGLELVMNFSSPSTESILLSFLENRQSDM